jgi:Zn-dependent protease with chaperone function
LLIKSAAGIAALTFSRSNEYQADTTGWEALTETAGFDQRGMITFFEKLMQLDPKGDGKTHWFVVRNLTLNHAIRFLFSRNLFPLLTMPASFARQGFDAPRNSRSH